MIKTIVKGCYGTQHNDAQHNGTLHNETQYNGTLHDGFTVTVYRAGAGL
jgi:hypothetical protein